MDIEYLNNMVEAERKAEGFTYIDFHYLEISSLLLTHAKDDVKYRGVVSRLIQDLYNLRSSKIMDLLKELKPENSKIKLTNIAAIELQTVRRMLSCTFDTLDQMNKNQMNA